MNIQQEHLERNKDPLLEEAFKIIMKLAKKYRRNLRVNKVKLEFNVDISKESIIFNMLDYHIT